MDEVWKLFTSYFWGLFFPFIAISVTGAAILFAGFRIGKVAGISFRQCLKVYITATAYGLALVLLLNISLRMLSPGLLTDRWVLQVVNLAILSATPLLVVPLSFKRFVSRRVLLIELVAVALTAIPTVTLLPLLVNRATSA
jgi:hypothetical protein